MHRRSLKITRECRNIRLSLAGGGRRRGAASLHRASHETIWISGKDQVVEKIAVIKEQVYIVYAVVVLDRGIVELRHTRVEESVTTAEDERLVIADRVRESDARSEVVRVERNAPGSSPKRIFLQATAKDLQVVAQSEIQREVIGYADRILHKG